ncbi:MAG TPA: hypothetical protein VGD43_12760 [Micromonospora sp.]
MSNAPVPGPGRFAVPRPPQRPVPTGAATYAMPGGSDGDSGHPAVDAAIQSIANAANLSPADQIAQYEAAYRTLQETLATIDQA